MNSNRKKLLLRLARILIIAAVVLGIAFFIRNAWQELKQQSFSNTSIQWPWLAISVLSYSVGLLPFWLYWHRVLVALGQSPTYWESFRAHLVGHLGKYVPGKAMVVVLRTALVKSERTHPAVAATAVFIETLTMMAVGAFVAMACLVPAVSEYPGLIILAVVLMLAAGIPTAPPIFQRIVAFLRVRRAHPEIEERLKGLTWRVTIFGWLVMTFGWLAFGFSLFATLQALPAPDPTLADLPRLIGSVALAVVAGFISLIPAGIGVRELVLLPLLSDFGAAQAVIAVVLARLSWLVSELGISSILYGLRWRSDRQSLASANGPR